MEGTGHRVRVGGVIRALGVEPVACPECGQTRGLTLTVDAVVHCPCGRIWETPQIPEEFAVAVVSAAYAAEDQIGTLEVFGGEVSGEVMDPGPIVRPAQP